MIDGKGVHPPGLESLAWNASAVGPTLSANGGALEPTATGIIPESVAVNKSER